MNYLVFQYFNGLAGHTVWFDQAIAFFSQYVEFVFAAILIVLWFKGVKNQRTTILAGLSAAIALGLAQVITHTYFHARPFMEHQVHQLIPHAAETSFPSDHATAAFALALMVWFRNRTLGKWMLVLALLTGLSRIIAGVHYPADIIGGAVVGFSGVLIVGALKKWLEKPIDWIISQYATLITRLPWLNLKQQDLK